MQKLSCEYLDQCPMFRYFRAGGKQTYADVYCLGSYEICHRRRRSIAGDPVPDNLLPHGGKLWEDDQNPPAFWQQDAAG